MISILEKFLNSTRGIKTKDKNEEALALKVTQDNAKIKATNSMINRISQGHDFGVVIGLDIETTLYGTEPDFKINKFIQPMREAFIFKGTGTNIINGKAFIGHLQESGHLEYPFGIDSLPPATSRQKDEISKQLNKIYARINSVSELFLTQTTYENDAPSDFLNFMKKIEYITKRDKKEDLLNI